MEQAISSPAVRVLVRRPSSSIDPAENSSEKPIGDGAVVIGFVGPDDEVIHLMNRILDARIFGAGREKDLFSSISLREDGSDVWFLRRGIRYHYESDKGIVYLRLSDGYLDERGENERINSYLNERDSDELFGFLLMFSICHVLVFLQEGARFDTNLMKKLRILQNAKNSLSNSVRSKARSHVLAKSSASPAIIGNNRRGSTARLMWGSGSLPSMLPGQCVPVMLFAFLHDFSDFLTETADSVATSSSKLEGAHKKKKLQTSLESQIRLLMKKCRVLSAQNASSVPLFSLDTSRVAVLLDRSTIRRGESLDYIGNILQLIIDSKASADLLESSDLESVGEDIQSVKDFISRQVDTLRGRGCLPSSGLTSSVTGVGMVAAAAAAAAASTAVPGKRVVAPDLPNLEKWLSLSARLLQDLLSAKNTDITADGGQFTEEKPAVSVRGMDGAVSLIEGCTRVNMKFSALWCQRALSASKEVYLKDLPACYPAIIHRAHLERALDSFYRRVRGPAVGLYAKRLEDECNSIWKSGRQLCDALSLTGKLCIHPVGHTVPDVLGKSKKHSSGFVSLHACACGRSRRLRDDPFDFDTANAGFNFFPSCEGQLPQLHLPEGHRIGYLPPSSWIIVRLGAASYYDPSTGLVQRGFCPNENFLLKWSLSSDNTLQFSSDMTDSSIMIEKAGESVAVSDQKRDVGNVTLGSLSSSFIDKGPILLMKKPFSEVVAGSSATKHPLENLPCNVMRKSESRQHPQTEEVEISAGQASQRIFNSSTGSFVQIGSNVVPVNSDREKNTEKNHSSKQIQIYIGFEHECPSGHRFMLSTKHLKAATSFLQRVPAPDVQNVEKTSIGPLEQANTFKEHHPSNGTGYGGDGAFLPFDKNLPVYINCPHCTDSANTNPQNLKFASRISQLQRIFLVTPPFPYVMSIFPVVQFGDSSLPASVLNREEQSKFHPECRIVLPPECFISLRLPFIYGVQSNGRSMTPLLPLEQQPELTASLAHGTVLQFASKG